MLVPTRGSQPTNFGAAVVALVGTLIAIYIVSQFLRNSIGVIAPNLASELGMSPAEIGLMSSVFFFAFAAVQIPLGMALDRFGPRLCLLAGAAITVLGAIVFAVAPSPHGAHLRPGPAGYRLVKRFHGIARGLCAPVSAGSLRHPGRAATRDRHRRHADRDGSAGILDGGDRMARQLSPGRRVHVRGRHAHRLRDPRRRNGLRPGPRRALGREHGRHRGGDPHALGRAALLDEYRGLFLVFDDRRPVGRPLPDAHLRLHPRGARQPAAHSGAGADRRLADLGADGPRRGRLQAAGSGRRGRQRSGARLPRGRRHAEPSWC